MKIRTIIFGVYVAVSGVGFVGVSAMMLREVQLRYVESMRRTLGDTAAFLGAFVTPVAQRSDAWAAKLDELPETTELLRVFACDRGGKVLFDSRNGRDVGSVYTFPLRGGGRAASENYTVSNVAEVDGELRVAARVKRDGEFVGWVGVGRKLSSVADGVQQARKELVWSLAGVAALMVAIGWWVATRLTKSIERLTAYAIAVRDGKQATPPRSQAQEVADLGRTFEEMRVALEGKAHVERYTQALAHEFKSPLSAIRGATELLAENPPEADRARFLANLRAETQRLQRIVERLLELAALETKRVDAEMSRVDLSAVLAKQMTEAAPLAELRGVTLAMREGASADIEVSGDGFLLGQAIGNLILNALEFSPRGGVVTLGASTGGEQICVVVEDQGPGLPDYAIEKVFDRFYSLPRPDTGRKSSGLGLSIVREVARLHGGEARIENRQEGGARAMLRLPRARANSR